MTYFDPDAFCANIERYKVTVSFVVPPIIVVLASHPGKSGSLSDIFLHVILTIHLTERKLRRNIICLVSRYLSQEQLRSEKVLLLRSMRVSANLALMS